MAIFPPQGAVDFHRGKDALRCRNVGCGHTLVPDRNDPRIMRCPGSCTMQRAKDIPDSSPFSMTRESSHDHGKVRAQSSPTERKPHFSQTMPRKYGT